MSIHKAAITITTMTSNIYPGRSSVADPRSLLISAMVIAWPPTSWISAGININIIAAKNAPIKPARIPRARKCFSNSLAIKLSVAPTKWSTSTISLFDARALLVAETMIAVVAAPIRRRTVIPPSARDLVTVRICACQYL